MHHTHTATHFEGPCGGLRRTTGQRIAHGIVWGGMIVAAGVLFLLEHLGMLGGYAAWSFWPLLLVVGGIESMFRRYRRLFGVTLALAGGLLLVWSLSLAPIQWGLVWPLLVIGLGLVCVVKVFTRKKRLPRPPFAGPHSPDSVMMGSKEERIDSQEWEGGEVKTVMGAYQIDLRGAEMKDERATLYAKAVMGAVEIIVPDHWKVEVKSSPVMGGIENKTREPADATKTLVIEAEVVLGGMEIRN